MTLDVTTETLVEFQQAAGEFPGERRPALATLHRWRQRGVRGVKLETLLVGGRRYTSKEAISRFIERQNAADADPSPVITPQQRRAQSESARCALSQEYGV